MLCDHLEGWDREGGREGDTRRKRYRNICICITDSLCYKQKHNVVKQLYSNKDVKKKKELYTAIKTVIMLAISHH